MPQPNWLPCHFQRRYDGVGPSRQHVGSLPSDGIISIPTDSQVVKMGGLPPSKSHLIRWLLLASQGNYPVEISGVSGAANDACAMRDALIQLGVEIVIEDDVWTVHGVGSNGYKIPDSDLNLHNSGTALRLLTMAVTRIGEWITIDGDSTLEPRIDRPFWESLGIDVGFESVHQNLPMKIKGPVNLNSLNLNCQKTSQHLSALILSMPARKETLNLAIDGVIVSRRHAQLSFQLASECGSSNTIENSRLEPWECKPPNRVAIPPDASHISFWKLYETIHDTIIELPKVHSKDSIGAEILFDLDLSQFQKIDLSEANDLITPLAAAMAIGGGGIIVGASHAQFKESNRITRTVEMLSQFSIDVEPTLDGLKINGGQRLVSPQSTVLTFGDHRMQMTAIVLASKVGAEIKGDKLHEVSFPRFIDCIQP